MNRCAPAVRLHCTVYDAYRETRSSQVKEREKRQVWTLKAKERALPRPLQNTASGRAGGSHHQTHQLTSNYGARYTLTNAQKIRSPPYKSEGMFHTSTLISISSKVPRGLRLLSQRLQITGGRNVWTCILEIGKGAHTEYK